MPHRAAGQQFVDSLAEVQQLQQAIVAIEPFRFWFIRHGATPSNIRCVRSGGDNDEALDESGRADCHALAARITPLFRPGVILTSPLLRTGETSAILSAAWGGIPVVVLEGLLERKLGAWNGLSYDETEPLLRAHETPPGGESEEAFATRIALALRTGLLPQLDRNPLIVSSKGVGRILNRLLGRREALTVPNAGAVEFCVSSTDDGRVFADLRTI